MERSIKAKKKPAKSNIGIQDPTYTRLIKAGKHIEANRYVDKLASDQNLKTYYIKPADRRKNSKSSGRKKSKSRKTSKQEDKKKQLKQAEPRTEFILESNPKIRAPMKSKKIKKSEASELKRHMFIFKTLRKSDKRTDIILKKAPLKLYKALRLLFKLLLKGAFPLKPTHRSKLKKWAPFIRQNSKGKHGDIKKRVSQNGEGLGDILKTVLPMIIPILSMMI